MTIIDLRQGLSDNSEYKAFKFPGGEVHFKLKHPANILISQNIRIIARVNNSDELVLLLLVIDTIKKDKDDANIEVLFPYMPFQQADMDFSMGESFSLKTITKLLNSLGVNKFIVFDPHSSVTPALLSNCSIIDNSEFVKSAIWEILFRKGINPKDSSSLVMLSPDAGAYKKIGKLATKIGFQGEVVSANKSRNISTGNIESLELSKQDFEGKDVMIVDDICVGGRTFVELAKKLKERNIGKLYLIVSHGIFSNGLEELNLHFDGIFVTDSRLDYFKDMDFMFQNDDEMHKLIVIKNMF